MIDINRLMSCVVKDELSGCWNRTKSVHRITGYSNYRILIENPNSPRRDVIRTGAHRASYCYYNGDIDNSGDTVIDHICRNKRCINPDHLRQVSDRQNALENSIGVAALNAIKTHCKEGHELAGDNLKMLSHNGKQRRCCAICHSNSVKNWQMNNEEKNKERIKKRYLEKKEELILKASARVKSYRENNREEALAKDAEYRNKNRDIINARRKAWREKRKSNGLKPT